MGIVFDDTTLFPRTLILQADATSRDIFLTRVSSYAAALTCITVRMLTERDNHIVDMLWDYIFVGGGLSASVVSSRLFSLDPTLKILVVEAGPNANNDPDIVYPNSTNLIGGTYDWQHETVPQAHLDGRSVSLPCGKALGGGTAINSGTFMGMPLRIATDLANHSAGGWSRGDKFDFDLWAETVDDHRWSYDGLLPYMRMTETAASAVVNPEQHGHDGPVHVQGVESTNREYPLREKVLSSWEAVGVDSIPYLDGNAAKPLGVGDLFENRNKGKRQIASVIYSLDGVTVLTDTLVAKVLLEEKRGHREQRHRAVGVKLANGTKIHGKEVILAAGAIRTPQILMLSGIGSSEELEKHNIDVTVESAQVGKNLADHGLYPVLWKIKDPSAGYAIGSGNPLFQEPQYGWGTPSDFLVSTGVFDKEGLANAIEEDEGIRPDPTKHPLLKQDRVFNEFVLQYAGAPDGSTVVFALINLLPTSRGSVTLASNDIHDAPRIDPNYHATAVDKFVARDGMRLQIKYAGTNVTVMGRDILDGELGAPGFDVPFTAESSDEYIDKRIASGLGYVSSSHWRLR